MNSCSAENQVRYCPDYALSFVHVRPDIGGQRFHYHERRDSIVYIRTFFIFVLLNSSIALMAPPADAAASTNAMAATRNEAAPRHDAAHDFDFIYGHWNVHNKRLTKRLQRSHKWIEFDATDDCVPLPGGLGNLETYRTDHWPGYTAIGLRLYSPDTKRWSLYWADNRNDPGTLQSPLVGGFSNGAGTFYEWIKFNGKRVKVRYTWRALDKNKARWEQAFSADAGKTWETNWIMDFTRTRG